MSTEKSPYIVYVKVNTDGYITAVNSSAFLVDSTGWLEIDSGYDSKFYHAQTAYFPKSVLTDGDACRYKLVDGSSVECTAEEIAQQEAALQPETGEGPTVWDELDAAYQEGVDSV